MRTTALALLAALALLGAGCGSDSEKGKPIPPGVATTLQNRLDVIESQFNAGAGACSDILDKTQPVVERDLQQVPSSVDPDVRKALRTSFDHLFDLVTTQCQGNTNTDTTQTDTTQTDTTQTDTTQTDTTQQTDTQQTDTQQTDTQPTTPDNAPPGQQKQKKPKKETDNGNGNGGGPAAPGGGG